MKSQISNCLKIDAFCHILPPEYKARLIKHAAKPLDLGKIIGAVPTLTDIQQRFKIMDQFPGLKQILTVSAPPLEAVTNPKDAQYLAKLANDELAELVEKYSDRFTGAVAMLPMSSIDAALLEIDRALKELKLSGIQMFTPVNGEAMDRGKFLPIYEKMAEHDLPIWVHPTRERISPDYTNEIKSKYSIYSIFGWPYETSAAMIRLAMSGILERFPNLRIITHHCGGTIPYFANRIALSYSFAGNLSIDKLKEMGTISQSPSDYLKMFFGDTALHGNTAALMCGHAFFGTEHMLFATDMPYDPELGSMSTRETIRSINEMSIPEQDKQMIFAGNIRRLLHLDGT